MCDLSPTSAPPRTRPSMMLRSSTAVRIALLLAPTTGAVALAGHALAAPLVAQTGAPVRALTAAQAGAKPAHDSAPPAAQMAAVPFGVGERMEYDVRYLGGKKGVGSMEVKEIVDVRGRPAWHTVFKVQGQVMFFSVNIMLESWFDVATMNSLRFHQDQRYTGTKRTQTIEIFPERGMYKEGKLEERVTVRDPLDDGSFLYFVRSLPLEVGKEYSFRQYYKPEKNPVKITVVRRETVRTPAGEFKTLVLRPEIISGGLFAEGKAEVWITDDAARMVVKLESQLPVGTISLHLTKFQPGTPFKP